MAGDMVVALAQTTADGHTLLGHSSVRPRGEPQAVLLVPGRVYPPGQRDRTTHLEIPRVRQTHTVLAARAGDQWGYQFGVNDRGLAIGLTAIHTRLATEGPHLTGSDLVRLALERAGSALQAVDVLTDLIGRHGQKGEANPLGPEINSDNAWVIADGREAYVLQACGHHWALQQVGGVRSITGVCDLRRDWDRISRGLADLAIHNGWWPEDGSKLDFGGALGREGPNHAARMLRWGQATVQLEQNNGRICPQLFRRLLASDQTESQGLVSATTMLVQLVSPLPLAWVRFGPGLLYFPLMPCGELPAAFGEQEGLGSRLWRQLSTWSEDARQDGRRRVHLLSGLSCLQDRYDQNAREFLAEVGVLDPQGDREERERLATSFFQHNLDWFEEFAAEVNGAGEGRQQQPRPRAEELASVPGGYF